MHILIISPHFPPTNAADMQRVRMILPYLAEAGATVEVLCVEPEQVASPQDAWLVAGLPPEIPIHRVKALGLKWSRLAGLGTLTYRALRAIRRKGNELLAKNQRPECRDQSSVGIFRQQGVFVGKASDSERDDSNAQGKLYHQRSAAFSLVYFSTTQFGLHVLGPEWKRKFGVSFVMDYQDPWVNDYYKEHPDVVPPGGRLKHEIANWLHRRHEPRVLRQCSGITSVSAAYPRQLARRYPWLQLDDVIATVKTSQKDAGSREDVRAAISGPTCGVCLLPSLVLPFPGNERDFRRVKDEGVQQAVFDPQDGLQHWVYVGRGGADMALAVRAIFFAISKLPSPTFNLKLHFIGTSYAAAGQGGKTIEPLAAEYGLEHIVREHPDRIPYSQTLRCLLDAQALIIPGSDDSAYTASKIYPYLLADKPLLAVFHELSSVTPLIREVGGANLVSFKSGDPPGEIGRKILRDAFDQHGCLRHVRLDLEAFKPHSGRKQALILADFFRLVHQNQLDGGIR